MFIIQHSDVICRRICAGAVAHIVRIQYVSCGSGGPVEETFAVDLSDSQALY